MTQPPRPLSACIYPRPSSPATPPGHGDMKHFRTGFTQGKKPLTDSAVRQGFEESIARQTYRGWFSFVDQASNGPSRLLHSAYLPLSGGDTQRFDGGEEVDVQVQKHAALYHKQATRSKASEDAVYWRFSRTEINLMLLWRSLNRGVWFN